MTRKGRAAILAGSLLAGCAHLSAPKPAVLGLVRLTEPLRVDGWLNEPIYERLPPVTDFKVASRPGATAPATKAWLQWDECGLWFAFAAHDTSLVTTPATSNEHEVDAQDRVELFLWPESSGRYFCVEFAPSGAVHDYAARVYRQFDDSWRPAGATFAARRTAEGYAVEGFMPVAVLREMGVCSWQAGARFHLGLYRADFRPEAPDDPVWLTWIEPNLPQPDFHVRATFALVELAP